MWKKAFLIVPGLLLAFAAITDVNAAKLSDLIKQTPKLYLPSQILPGKSATFTLQGKPGKTAKIILSSKPQGLELPNGTMLRVGTPNVEQTGTIPASGVVEIVVPIPDDVDALGDKQFVEAIVWSDPAQSDAEPAEIITNNGTLASQNLVVVGTESDGGSTMLIPGSPGLSDIMRTVNTLTEANSDPRKKELLDTGAINRNRYLDQTLNLMPNR